MELNQARLGMLTIPSTATWTGSVTAYDEATYTLTVSTSTGALGAWMRNLVLIHASFEMVRVREVDAVLGTIKLAENPVTFAGGDTVSIYNARYPWSRYQTISNGVVYKDGDIAFPDPWQRELPPSPVASVRKVGGAWSEAVVVSVYESFDATAIASVPNITTGSPLSYAWSAGFGGVVTGTGPEVSIMFTTPGFRYLLCTITDANGTEAYRYIPVWVNPEYTAVLSSCSARWAYNKGWEVDLSIEAPISMLRYSQACIVDLESGDVIFLGYLVIDRDTSTFERSRWSFKLLPALAFSSYLHAYPFIVTNITGVTTPSNWAQVYELTTARAFWFLIYWHSTLSEVSNVSVSAGESIAGQEFRGGSLISQVDYLTKSTFWAVRGYLSGGVVVTPQELYKDAATWAGYSAVNLTAGSSLEGEVEINRAQPSVSEVFAEGVYRAPGGNYAPARTRAPAHPDAFGAPAELNSLAPHDEAQLRLWAGRHYGIENYSDKVTLKPRSWIDPAMYHLVDFMDKARGKTERAAVEGARLEYKAASGRWAFSIEARTFGVTAGAVMIIYPPIETIPTPPPPSLPPVPPLPPRPESWPTEWYFFSNLLGVYKTNNFPQPSSLAQPTWTAINTGLNSLKCRVGAMNESVGYLFMLTEDERCIYRRSAEAASWAVSLTAAQARVALGVGAGTLHWVTVDQSTGHVYAYFSGAIYDVGQYIFKSVDNGVSWTNWKILDAGPIYQVGNLFVRGNVMWRTLNIGGWISYSPDSGQNWIDNNNLGASSWTPWATVSALDTSKALVAGNGFGGPDLVKVQAPGMSLTVLQDSKNLGLGHPDLLAILANRWNFQRVMSGGKIYSTTDGWQTLVTANPPTINLAGICHLLMPMTTQTDWLVTGRYEGLTSGSPHGVLTLTRYDAEPRGRSGSSAGSAPYTNSIPCTCGGACYHGILFKR